MAENRYSVAVTDEGSGWSVRILDPSRLPVFERACADEVEARTYASTVRQHIGWLSEKRFREYYRIERVS